MARPSRRFSPAMRTAVALSLLLMLATSAPAEEEDKPKPAPIPGIRWEPEFQAGVVRAEQEGRPLFFAVNAVETERANNRLAAYEYKSERWGRATRGYACFVANYETHAQANVPTVAESMCTRYLGIRCSGHQGPMGWLMLRFGNDLISPQHIIIERRFNVAQFAITKRVCRIKKLVGQYPHIFRGLDVNLADNPVLAGKGQAAP